MKFVRSKKLVFLNNKGGVWKTTLAFNTATKFAEKGYKTVLIDLDPQCNLSRLALGERFEESLFWAMGNIYHVLRPIIEAKWDVDTTISFFPLAENLLILPGSLLLSEYQDMLLSAYMNAMSGQPSGYTQTSAINRFFMTRGMRDEVDIFIIDASPSLDLLNRIILLGSDYFITPLMPDAFSLQWIENLWNTLTKWKENWHNGAKSMAITRDIPVSDLLSGEWLFIGYIINSYNQYAGKPIQSHSQWMEKIPWSVKQFLSLQHCRNWLVEKSWTCPLQIIKDYGELPSDAQIVSKAIFNLVPGPDCQDVVWVRENLDIAREQYEELFDHIEEILQRY